MTARITETIEVKNFLNTATTFCNLVRRPNSVDIATFLAKLEILLPLLCSSVLLLPRMERSPDYSGKWSHDTWQKLYKKLQNYLGKYDSYCRVYDPYDPGRNKPEMGSLADDLSDIYFDLSPGLSAWKRAGLDKRRAILDDWQMTFSGHWSYHLVSAWWSIHWIVYFYDVVPFVGYKTKKRIRRINH